MKIITAVIFLLLSCVTLAQWNIVDQIYSPLALTIHGSGDDLYAGTTDSMYISNDRGASWRSVNFMQDSLATVSAIIKKDDILYAGTYGEGVFKSPDNGVSWEAYSTGLSGFSLNSSLLYFSGDTLFLGTDGGGMYYRITTENSGWVQFNNGISMNVASTANDFAVTSSTYLYSGGASGFYYIREKNSAHWTDIEFISLPDSIPRGTPNAFLTFNDTVLACSRFGIFRSVDLGYTWKYVGVSALPLNVVVLKKYAHRIYAGFTRAQDFFVWYSDDNGDTWNVLDHQFAFLIDLILYDNRLWAATGSGVWYSSPITDVPEENIIPQKYKLLQNYPNPFNPTTNFEFRIADFGIVELKVYDLLGREVAIAVNREMSPGEYRIPFNASGLASGIYYYQLKVNDYRETKKFVLLK